MSKSLKAALLSALLFPGVGHFFLKKNVTGSIFAVTTLVALYVLVSNVVNRALLVAEQLQTGEVAADVATISELISRQAAGTGANTLGIASTVLLVCWLLAIVDCYRIASADETSNGETG